MPIIAFFTSLLFGLTLVPVVRRGCHRLGIVAAPRADRWHAKPTPKMGGVGIFLAFGLTLGILTFFYPFESHHWPLIAGAFLIFILGVLDDFRQITPPAKLIGEIIAAAIVVLFGRNIDFFDGQYLNIIFTFFWLVGITNAINLLDNMDGLAGGVSLIAALLLSFLFWKTGSYDLLLISLVLAGGILGFLVFNFPPASILWETAVVCS
ncbi:MAG: undecaprenyl/decaprenyl-phosphate alpha-N-acetylglucosaminyl 1-phosphate transferase [Anaerolineales bacterium]|nr:undecaprenyl/decaprenyl-phosphate alpha-N-acetylglucosaminyl 1-phosphate transferase [Anaerolineales bacterium]